MTYIEGFIAAVPIANKNAYVDHATGLAPLIRELGATRMVQSWSDDVPEARSPTSASRSRQRMTKRWSSPGSNIPTGPRGMPRTRR